MIGNAFSGTVPVSMINNTQLKWLDLSNNQLGGEVDANFANESLDLTRLVVAGGLWRHEFALHSDSQRKQLHRAGITYRDVSVLMTFRFHPAYQPKQ